MIQQAVATYKIPTHQNTLKLKEALRLIANRIERESFSFGSLSTPPNPIDMPHAFALFQIYALAKSVLENEADEDLAH